MIAATGFGLVVSPLALVAPAQAAPDGSSLVISEVYGGGGNTGARTTTRTSSSLQPHRRCDQPHGHVRPVPQLRPAPAAQAPFALSGRVPAHEPLPGPGGTAGATVTRQAATHSRRDREHASRWLLPTAWSSWCQSTTPFTATGDLAGNAACVDMVGFATPTSFETASTGSPADHHAQLRTGPPPATDTDNNAERLQRAPHRHAKPCEDVDASADGVHRLDRGDPGHRRRDLPARG